MKITMVVSGWPDANEPARSVFNKRHAKQLVLQGHEVNVIFIRALNPFKRLTKSYSQDSVEITEVRIMPPFGSFTIKDWVSVFLLKFLKFVNILNTDTNVVHCIGGHAVALSYQIANFSKSNFIVHYIGGDINCDFDGLLSSKIFLKAINKASFHGFESKGLHEIFYSKFPNLSNTEVIYRGITTDVPKYEKVKISNHFTLIYLGGKPSDGMTKGIYVLLNAISSLGKKDLNHTFEFLLGGPGILDINKSTILFSNEKIKVHVIGTLSRTEVVEYMAKADICIIPSYNEGLPNVMWESMIYGCLIVATKVGGIPEIIETGKEGRLFNIGEYEELAEILYDIDKKPEQIDYMVLRAKNKVAKYDYSNFIGNYIKKYQKFSN